MKQFFKIVQSSLLIGFVVFIIERWISGGFGGSSTELFQYYLIMSMYSFFINYVNTLYYKYLNGFISWSENPKKRLLYGALGSIILTMLVIVILRIIIVFLFEQGTWQDFLKTSKFYYIFSLIVTANILIIIHAIYFFKAMTDKKVTKHKVIGKTETAKFESLKNQLDPHFLFNSLNVLTSLIGENPKQAEKFTTKLSKIYRYVLTQKNEDLVLATDELQFAKNYMELLKIRFEDAVSFEIPDRLSSENLKIIPLSLQLLLENAMKHNTITSKKKLSIRIYEQDNYLVIENNINPKSNLEKSTKVGLKNIIDRYALVTKLAVIIKNNQQVFKVKLPLLIKKSTIMNANYDNEEKYYSAKKQVHKMRDFYITLFMYILFVPFIIFIWYNYSSHTLQWFWFPIFGWGLGLVFQGADAFNKFPLFGRDWEKRKIKEMMEEHDDELKF